MAVFKKIKYMNIHSTIQYIYISTIEVHEHYKTQKTEHTEEHRTYTKKHIHEKKTRKYEKNTEKLICCPEKNPGRQAYSSSLHSLSYPDPVCKPLHFVSLHSASLSLHLTSHHFYRPTSIP
jgi:hypothetical protein